MDDCDSNAEIVLSLKALRAKYREVELLMKSIDNADGVRTVLCQINVEFDRLMNMCCNIDENQTIPGSASHKIEVINSGNAFKDKVECWLLGTEMPVKCNISGDTGGVGVCSELHAENAVKVRCDDVGDKTCSSVGTSSRVSSSSSRLRKSRVKVQLARLALCHEKERLRENCEKATREKERQLEMAEAELEAWEAESVCSISRRSRTTSRSVHDVMPTTVAQPTPELACNNQAQKGLNLPTSNGKATLSPPYRCLTNSSSYPGAGKSQSVEHVSFMPAEPIVEGIGSQKRTRWDMPRGGGKSAGEMQSGAPGLGCSSEQKMCVTNQEPMPCHAGYVQQTSPSVEVSERYLPKPAIEEFDGDPLDYWAFVNRFKVHIADRIRSIDLKLVYLLQHCSRRVYDRIKHFASGPDKRHCYDMVWRELYDRYGQPHVIGRHCEERLLEVGKISQHDSESLESLAILMKRCLAAMEEFSGFSTINTVGFIAALVDKLPLEMRRRWVSRALSLQADNGRLAGFADFAHFVIGEAAEANSIYYKAIFPYRPNIRGDGGGAKRPKAHAFAVSARSNVKTSADVKNIVRNNSKDDKLQCWHCGKSHKLEQCSEFIDLQYAEKKRVVRSKRLCYRCLRGGHVVKDCRSRLACSIESCKSTDHHTLLHLDPVQVEGSDVVCSAVSVRLRHVCLDIVPVRVSNGGVDVLTYALLDPGSSVSFCERVLIEKLGLCGDGNMVETCVETLTTEKPERLKSESFSLRVKSLDDTNAFCLDKVILIDQIPVGPDRRNLCDDIDGFEHLEGVTLPQIDKATVTLLIGNDNYLAQFPLETRLASNPESSPHAIRTPLGWVLKGPSLTTEQSSAGNSVSCLLSQGRVPECIEALRDSIVTDEGEVYGPSVGLGAADVENLMSWLRSNVQVQQFGMRYSAEDVVAYDLMNKSVAREEGHFRLPLLWRNDAVVLPESLTMAKKRLSAVKQRLKRDSNLKDMYCKEMQALLDEGYAEVVSSDQNVASSRVWYIPHHAVLNANKPGRVRVVYDCAARSHGTSLNENLMRGPDFVNSLMGVLLRFRKNRVAIVSDIKGMFHQVRCAPKDRDALRFLWYPEGNLEAEPVPHRMMVHLFGAKSSPSCAAFALLQTAKVYGKLYNPTVSDVVRKCFYVDDCLVSVDSDEAGVRLVQDLSELLARGGFHLTKWVSTSEAVMKSVLFEDRAKSTCNLNLGAEVDERVLGMKWHVTSDTFGYQVRLPDKPITRRGLLSVSSSLFDPLGLVSPVVLEARLLLRSLCQGGLGWDDPIPFSEAVRWKQWREGLALLEKLKIPRSFKPVSEVRSVQMHVFADASSYARGCVCYLRVEGSNGDTRCIIVAAKSRLAEPGVNTIPRLELEAALDAVKLSEMVRRELEMPDCPCLFWTDSSIVLLSLRAESKKFPVFTRNRLSQIERHTCIHDWRHVPSELNPADYASRGCTVVKLLASEIWFNGPEFLKKDPKDWPLKFPLPVKEGNIYAEFDLPQRKSVSLLVKESDCEVDGTDKLISHYSSWYKLTLSTAWLLRLKEYLRKRIKGEDIHPLERRIDVSELQQAELMLVSYVQRQEFPEWISKLSGRSTSTKLSHSSVLYHLNPALFGNILRVGGRLANANLSFEAKHPAILPQKGHLTSLIIQDCHTRLAGHQGVNATLNHLMQKFWVVNAKAAVKAVIKDCLFCTRRSARPGAQIMADLPPARLQMHEAPFAHTGVDYFGPFVIKQRRSEIKRYGCIMTCMTTRAIHLEVAPDLSTSSFVNVLRRFVARRGTVTCLYSDNGTNFVGSERILRESIQAWNKQQIHEHLRQSGIKWFFNPPGASHMGGAWERMVGLVKRILGAIVPGKIMDDDTLHTLLLEVEAIVNSRPLTDVFVDGDTDLPLTPNHLLRINHSIGLPPMPTDKSDVYARRRYRLVQFAADEFWRRWILEYPRTLFPRRKWEERRENIRRGDVVLVVDTTSPRGEWLLGRVVELFPDKHGVVRIVNVKTKSGTLKRPITKLCVIVKADESDAGHKA